MKILVATDGSEASEAVLEVMQTRPWPQGSQVRVLVVSEPVYPPPPPPAGMMFGGTAPDVGTGIKDVNDRLLQEALRLAQRSAELIRPNVAEAEAVALSGDPRDVIVDSASEWGADLIVLGSHGRTGLKRWVLGSVAESVVRHAPCSVEVAKRKQSAES
jgi:nucleotide-binding universal stress UspA family protein